MSPPGSVTMWISEVKAGNREAVAKLWQRYFERLVWTARDQLRRMPRSNAEGEDIALGAFECFCRNAESGRFARLSNRHSLWSLLVKVARRMAISQAREQQRQKRGAGKVFNEADLYFSQDPGESLLELVPGGDPGPEQAAEFADEVRWLIAILREEVLRQVALLKLKSYSTEEIAAKLGISERSVERKSRLIRAHWSREVQR